MGSMHTPACTARRPLAVRACLGPLLHRPRPQGEAFLSRRPQLPRPAYRRLQLAAQGQRPGGGDPSERAQRKEDQRIILGTCLALTGVAAAAVQFGGDSLLELASWQGLDLGGDVDLGAGDLLGAALWSLSLYYASPWQLLLLFLGKIETERPSDGVLRFFGQLGGLPVDAVDYEAPAGVRAATVATFAATGFVVAAASAALLGDASWSVSAGLGACVAAGMYEVGRPDRLSVEQAQLLEAQWKDFEVFADEKLQRSGRCHESEVIRAFRRQFGRYRLPSQISDATIRDMIRNWHAGADRTPSGYYKNLSLRQYGAAATTPPPAAAAAAAAAAGGGGGGTAGGLAEPAETPDSL